jgi:diguanylate cyclase (GGDEF)-like protein
MGEVDLHEIEKRTDQYPLQARHDILLLTSELRRLYRAGGAAQPNSSLYDALTGLLNGGAYGVRFAMARARATRYRKIFAVMSIDVEFPPGTGVGKERDPTMRAVAMRLESCVRATDTLARIGEDNFAVILEDLTQAGHAERVKQNVEAALAEPMPVGETDIVPVTHVHLQFYPRPEGAVH